jgi:K+:H+ antiporter
MHTESTLLTLIIQLILIIAAGRAAGALFRFLGQPQVCGEIAAGLMLGPSVFGMLFPKLHVFLFNPAASEHLNVLSQIGLVFMMFLIGLEFDFSHLHGNHRSAMAISSAGIVLPFVLGLGLGHLLYSILEIHVSHLGFVLFVATSLSITAIPTLGRIMMEFNIQRTRLGVLTITAAAMDDAAGWLLLALCSAVVQSDLRPGHFALIAVAVVGYLLFMVLIARPLLVRWVGHMMKSSKPELSLNHLAQVLVLLFLSAAITNLIGIFSIFGAFALGAVLYDQVEFRVAVNRRLSDFIIVFFLPIFFTYTGLHTDIGSMYTRSVWLLCGLVTLVASIGKFGGCALMAGLHGIRWREAFCVGTMMNTRGLMELIVLNTGYNLGIIPKPVFFMLVIMAIGTTYMTAPVLTLLIRGTALQKDFQASQFMQKRRAQFTISRGSLPPIDSGRYFPTGPTEY